MNQPANMEQKTVNDILIWIAQRGDDIQDAPEQVQRIQDRTFYYRKISSRELETMLTVGAPRTVNMLDNKAFIYLPPIKKGNCIVPILCVEYDYATEMPELTLRIALFLFDGENNLKAIGYRFETAHNRERHHYYHIQHINKFDPSDESDRYKLPDTEWVPIEYPAFPIDAQNPIELLICLLVSLYDLTIIKKFEGKIKTIIGSHVKRMKLSMFLT